MSNAFWSRCANQTRFLTFLELMQSNYTLASAKFPLDFQCVFLGLSVLAFGSNSVCVAIVRRPRFRREHRRLCGQLLLLSMAEVVFTGLFSLWTIFQLMERFQGWRKVAPWLCAVVYVVLQWLTDSAVFVRNWCVLLIALARCEAISRPLTRLHRPICSLRRLCAAAVFMGVLSLLSTALHFYILRDFGTCHPRLANSSHTDVIQVNEGSELVEIIITFAMQRGIPVALITLTTAVIVITLCRRRVANRSSLRATRTVVALTVTFILLEGVFFVYYILAAAAVVDVREIEDGMDMANRICLILDSCLNALIYVMSNRTFSNELKAVCGCCKKHSIPILNRGERIAQHGPQIMNTVRAK